MSVNIHKHKCIFPFIPYSIVMRFRCNISLYVGWLKERFLRERELHTFVPVVTLILVVYSAFIIIMFHYARSDRIFLWLFVVQIINIVKGQYVNLAKGYKFERVNFNLLIKIIKQFFLFCMLFWFVRFFHFSIFIFWKWIAFFLFCFFWNEN